MTFRDPHGIPKVAPLCPGVKEVKVIYNVFEFNYDASVDKLLVHLELFPEYVQGNMTLNAGTKHPHVQLLTVLEISAL